MILEKVYDELISQIEDLKKAVAAMSGGTDEYDDLSNRPKVNNITLTGNKKSSDLKIAYSMTEAEYAAATKNAESIYCLQENATTFEEEDETASSYIEWSAGDPSGYVATWAYTPSNQNFTGCTAVECDDAAITVETFTVVEGSVQVFLSCDDTTQIGETVTFTYTLTQPAGSTRIMKNGLQYGTKFDVLEYTEHNTAGDTSYLLAHPITDYDLVMFQHHFAGGSGNGWNPAGTFPVAALMADRSGYNKSFWVDGGNNDRAMQIQIVDATHYKILNAGDSNSLCGVYGIKF